MADNLTNINIDDKNKRARSAKYLGVIEDENLNWHDLISELNPTLIKQAYFKNENVHHHKTKLLDTVLVFTNINEK